MSLHAKEWLPEFLSLHCSNLQDKNLPTWVRSVLFFSNWMDVKCQKNKQFGLLIVIEFWKEKIVIAIESLYLHRV